MTTAVPNQRKCIWRFQKLSFEDGNRFSFRKYSCIEMPGDTV